MTPVSSSSHSCPVGMLEPSQNTEQHCPSRLGLCTSAPGQSEVGHTHWRQTEWLGSNIGRLGRSRPRGEGMDDCYT